MSFRTEYPEYSSIEHLIRRARAERSVAIAHYLAGFVVATGRGLKALANALTTGAKVERDAHAMQVDALFRKRIARH